MTFETPGQRAQLRVTEHIPGWVGSMRLLGGDGSLAVSAGVRADSPSEAAMIVARAVYDRWPKQRGPVQLSSWTAHRARALFGRRSALPWDTIWPFDDGGDEGGSAGVREPRRPLPGPGSLHAARDLPDGRAAQLP
jgi:hypothetical protein